VLEQFMDLGFEFCNCKK